MGLFFASARLKLSNRRKPVFSYLFPLIEIFLRPLRKNKVDHRHQHTISRLNDSSQSRFERVENCSIGTVGPFKIPNGQVILGSKRNFCFDRFTNGCYFSQDQGVTVFSFDTAGNLIFLRQVAFNRFITKSWYSYGKYKSIRHVAI